MGVEVNVWRARIGAFAGRKASASSVNDDNSDSATNPKSQYEFGLIIGILLIIAGLEMNPGPLTSEDIKQIVAALQPQFDEVNRKQSETIQQELSNVRHTMDEFKTCCTSQYKELKGEIQDLKERNSELQDIVTNHESIARKNNIVIHGIQEQDTISAEQVVKSICGELRVDISEENISEAFRIGRNKGKRPIVCKLNSFKKKKEIMEKSRAYKETEYYISHDLSKAEREAKQKLKMYREYAIRQNLRAHIRGTKLVINGQTWTYEELRESFGDEIQEREPTHMQNRVHTNQNNATKAPVEKNNTANVDLTTQDIARTGAENAGQRKPDKMAAEEWPQPGSSETRDDHPTEMDIQIEKSAKRSYSTAVTGGSQHMTGDVDIIKKINKNFGSLIEKNKSPPKRGKIVPPV
jgi:polyhydroxyalkanoate synthesis regulator phasin